MTQRYPLPVEDERPETPTPVQAPAQPKPPLAQPLTPTETEAAKERIIEALHKCFDPEIPVNIYELGLIYEITIAPTGAVDVQMTLTSPGCPVAGSLVGEVQRKVAALPQVKSSRVDLVWDPPWDKSRMSEEVALELGLM